MNKRKNILKDAGVLLIAAILLLTAVFIPMSMAQTSEHDVGVPEIISPTTGPIGVPIDRSWSDSFDSYANDQYLDGTGDDGGWKGYGGVPTAGAYVRDDQAFSAPHSVEITGASDLVHECTGYNTGAYNYTAMQYIPTDFSGISYFILMSAYDDGGTTNVWAVQLHFDSTLDLVESDFNAEQLPIIYGQWVEIKCVISLDTDWLEIFYGGGLLAEHAWTDTIQGTGGGSLNIAAVNLCANNATPVYYDDISLGSGDIINIFGFNHIPLGDATLNVVNGTLVVSNIGTSGNDGVQVILPEDLVNFRPEIEFPAAQDMSLALTSKGIVDGEPDQVATVTSFDITNGGKTIQMTFDPSALQPQYLWAHYYVNGSPMPIKSEKILMGGNRTNPMWGITLATGIEDFKVSVEAIPRQIVAMHTDVDKLSYAGPYSQSLSNMEDNGICCNFDMNGKKGNVSTPEGNETTVDTIWIYTQNCTFQLQNYTDITLKATAINPTSISFTIANEKALFPQTKLNPPEMTGPENGKIFRKYDYTVNGIDPQGGNVFYWVYRGDDSSVGWLGPYNSGASTTVSYNWWYKGNYTIGAIVKNIDGFYSGWKVLSLTMPKDIVPNPWFLQFLLNHPHAFPILRHLMGL